MTKVKRVLLVFWLSMALIIVQAVLAKGTPDKVIISGAGLPHPLEFTDTCMLNALALGNLEDMATPVSAPPPVVGDGYLVTRYLRQESGDYLPFDTARYYIDPQDGHGYVYDAGGVDSALTGQWFRATEQSQSLMTNFMLNPSGQDDQHSKLHKFLIALANLVQ